MFVFHVEGKGIYPKYSSPDIFEAERKAILGCSDIRYLANITADNFMGREELESSYLLSVVHTHNDCLGGLAHGSTDGVL